MVEWTKPVNAPATPHYLRHERLHQMAPSGSWALGLLLARKSQADGGGIHGDTVTEGLPAARYRGIVQFALRHAVVD